MTRGRTLGPGSLTRRENAGGSSSWVLDYRDHDGRRQRKVLSTDRRIAEQQRADLIRQRDLHLAGLGVSDEQTRTLSALMELYLADVESRSTLAHASDQRRRLTRVIKAIGAQRVVDLRPIAVIQYRTTMLRAGFSNRSCNAEISALSTMLNWGVKNGLLAVNGIRGMQRLSLAEGHLRRRRRALTEDEIGRLLEAVESDDRRCAAQGRGVVPARPDDRGPLALVYPRVRLPQMPLIRAYVETGARYYELASLSWADVDLASRMITLRARNTKSRRERKIPIRTEFAEVLASLRALHERVLGRTARDSDRVFLSPKGRPLPRSADVGQSVLRRALCAAGIPRMTADGCADLHGLRHSSATRWARAGVPLLHAQQLLGHSDPKLTAKVYTHLNAEDLRASIELVAVPPTRTTERGDNEATV